MKKFFVLFLVGIIGCGGHRGNGVGVRPLNAMNGNRYYRATCQYSVSDCQLNMESVCNGSYKVIESESHAGGTIIDILPGPVVWYTVTFTCN